MSADGGIPGFDPIAAALEALEDFGAPVDDLKLSFYPLNDLGNRSRFLDRFGKEVLNVPNIGVMFWTGTHWKADISGAKVRIMAQRSVEAIKKLELPALKDDASPDNPEQHKTYEKALFRHSNDSCSSARVTAIVKESLPHRELQHASLNTRADIFNCPNTALLLTTDGGVKPTQHDRAHLSTRLAGAAFDPAATCPEWDKFIEQVMPDPDERAYLQRSLGACLTDSSGDQKLIVHHGSGANGKSTCLDAVCHALGDYAMSVDVASLLYGGEKQGSAASPDIARLAEGPRLVRASEPELGSRLSESHVKSITGGEPIVARMLHRPPMEFRPGFKIHLSCNSRPSIRGGDDGIWRRIDLLHWKVQIPVNERDPHLPDKLKAEASGILNWLIRGLEDWMEVGLATPESVLASTAEYREDSDPFRRFILEWCERGPEFKANTTELFNAYCLWCAEYGEKRTTQRWFGSRLTDRGFEKKSSGGTVYRFGIQLSAAGRAAFENLELKQLEDGPRRRRRADVPDGED